MGRNREAPIVLPVPPRKECKYSFSTLIHDKHKKSVYAFKDHDFYVVRHNTGEKPKGPKSVSSRWKGLDIRVRAAYTRNDGYTIFFTRHRYDRTLSSLEVVILNNSTLRFFRNTAYVYDYQSFDPLVWILHQC